jgi:hypothetical protein
MRTIEGIIPSDVQVNEPCFIRAIVNGSIEVTASGKLEFHGICNGRIHVQTGGSVQVNGIVNGGVDYEYPEMLP